MRWLWRVDGARPAVRSCRKRAAKAAKVGTATIDTPGCAMRVSASNSCAAASATSQSVAPVDFRTRTPSRIRQ